MDWEEVNHVAERIFNVWFSGGDLEWAEKAWHILSNSGLTGDATELERCKSVIRLLCLGDYYYNFCTLYKDEFLETELVDWASTFPIHGFQIGQLIGENALEDETEPDVFYQKGLELLTDRYEEEVMEALKQGFGDRCSLFISLWRSSFSSERNEPDSPDFVADLEVLNEQLPTGEFAALAFGCSIKEIRNYSNAS